MVHNLIKCMQYRFSVFCLQMQENEKECDVSLYA